MTFISSLKCIALGECYPYNFHFSVFDLLSSVILWNPGKFPRQLTYPFPDPNKGLLILSLKIHHILCNFSIFHNSHFLLFWHVFLVVQLYRRSLLLSEMELVFCLSFSLLFWVISKRKGGQELLYSAILKLAGVGMLFCGGLWEVISSTLMPPGIPLNQTCLPSLVRWNLSMCVHS